MATELVGTVFSEEPINWGPVVRDQMSRDHMHLGPSVSQPIMNRCKKSDEMGKSSVKNSADLLYG